MDSCSSEPTPVRDNVRVATPSDSDYPVALHDLPDPPKTIWMRGTPAIAEAPAVAIVGTRNPTPYGVRVTRMLAESCARAGICVVSGLARGIDGTAHESALTAGGRTVAVLGTGVNRYYPRRHKTLQERIAEHGLLITEHPPESLGHGGAFPLRNRIIAALAPVVVVVEAGVPSGARITAERARDLGRIVAAVPGPIDSPASAGSNALLTEAVPIVSPQSLLDLFELSAAPPVLPALDGDAALCWDAIRQGATSIDEIAAITELSNRESMLALSALEIDGLVEVDLTGTVLPLVAIAN